MKPTPKEIDRRIAKASAFAAEQARRRGEGEVAARQQGAHAAEATFRQLKEAGR